MSVRNISISVFQLAGILFILGRPALTSEGICSEDCQRRQRTALQDIFTATGGFNWTYNAGWQASGADNSINVNGPILSVWPSCQEQPLHQNMPLELMLYSRCKILLKTSVADLNSVFSVELHRLPEIRWYSQTFQY